MDPLTLWIHVSIRLHHGGRHLSERLRSREERGDVPGWVLVTVMTLTIGFGLFSLARPELTQMLRSALNSVQ